MALSISMQAYIMTLQYVGGIIARALHALLSHSPMLWHTFPPYTLTRCLATGTDPDAWVGSRVRSNSVPCEVTKMMHNRR